MQKHDLTLQTIIEIFEKMGEKKKIEKAQKYFMIVWARAQFLKFLRSRSQVWRARAQTAAQSKRSALNGATTFCKSLYINVRFLSSIMKYFGFIILTRSVQSVYIRSQCNATQPSPISFFHFMSLCNAQLFQNVRLFRCFVCFTIAAYGKFKQPQNWDKNFYSNFVTKNQIIACYIKRLA